jgi:hypothetical protein
MGDKIIVSICAFALASGAHCARAQQDPLEIVPADASAAIAVRSLETLRARGDQLVTDLKLPAALRPNTALTVGYFLLGIGGYVDETRPAALIFSATDEQGRHDAVLALPVKDVDRLRARLGLADKAGEVTPLKGRRDVGKLGGVRGKHLFLGDSKEAVARVLRGKPLAAVLSPAQRQGFAGADFVIQASPATWKRHWEPAAAALLERAVQNSPAEDAQSLREMYHAVREVQSVVGAVRMEGGLSAHLLMLFPDKDSLARRRLFSALGIRRKPASLRGLPDGPVLCAYAGGGEGADSLVLVRPLVRRLLGYFGDRKVLSPADHPMYVDLLTHVWGRVKGNRAALYVTTGGLVTDELTSHGQCSVIAILDTDDAAGLVRDLRELAAVADHPDLDKAPPGKASAVDIAGLIKDLDSPRFRDRELATLKLRLVGEPALPQLKKAMDAPRSLEAFRRAEKVWVVISTAIAERRKELLADDLPALRPRLTFIPRAEPLARHNVDVVRITLESKDVETARQLAALLGPQWDRLRLAAHENQVVVLLGSRVDLLEQTLENLNAGRPGLAAAKAARRLRAPGSYKQEAHVSLNTLLEVPLEGNPAGERRPVRSLISCGLAVEDGGLILDVWVPEEELGSLADRARLVFGGVLAGVR